MKNNNFDLYSDLPKRDLRDGLVSHRIWVTFGLHDIRQRYRRSVIGPFWFTLSTAIMVGVLGLLYSQLFVQDLAGYLPYLAVGLIVWQFLSTSIIEGCDIFLSSATLIKQIKMPLTVFVCRVSFRNFLILLHSLPVAVVAFLMFGNIPTANFFLLPFGLLLLFLHAIWIGVFLGILCARYRDVIPIVNSMVTVSFFFTPVMWMPELLQDRAWIAEFNPFYHIIEIIRAPIVGRPITLNSWIWTISFLFLGFLMAHALLLKYRNRVAFWI